MIQPAATATTLPCSDCANAGRPGVVMQFIAFDQQWMNVSTSEPDSFFPGAVIIRTERKKVRCELWRCPHGHRQQTVSR